ncbi:non-processive endocellulase [Alteromonadaceae bacterium Bs31]|nr:non-processive endocellulase [Alteromonadaceae bacterium Bs31]
MFPLVYLIRSRFVSNTKKIGKVGMPMYRFFLPVTLVIVLVSACSGSGGGSGGTNSGSSSSSSSSSSSNSSSSSSGSSSVSAELIKANQVGYLPEGQKYAVVPEVMATQFELIDSSGTRAYAGTLSSPANWEPAGESVKLADFSEFTTAGRYQLRVAGLADSAPFDIADGVYGPLHDAALKAYYYNRASTELLVTHAGDWARPAGHADTDVEVHSSAASQLRPAGTKISAPKGWYDAGDFGKYIVNSGISTYTLLAAYEQFPDYYADRTWNIPESNNAIPDLLDEVLWNLDWMAAMQDPNDGGVYHKLTTANFAGELMPHEAKAQRYVIQKSTAAALNFAAVMATASRVFKNFDASFPGKAEHYLLMAENAWNWAKANPADLYAANPDGLNTGTYGDDDVSDEFAWAAAELYISTGEAGYLSEFNAQNASSGLPGWSNVSPLAFVSLSFHGEGLLQASELAEVNDALLSTANGYESTYSSSAYRVSMRDFYWGSNSSAMNQALMLLQAYRISDDDKYRNAALGLVDYVLGKNPTDYSYVTGIGARPPMHIHHRQSRADDVLAPVPGFLAGGPNPGQQDKCDYPSILPAKSYVDDWCSYASNEVTINWNAPLIYVLAALASL